MVSLPDGYAFPVNTSASASPETFPSCPISRILFTSFTGFKSTNPPIFNTKTKCLYFLFKASISLFSVSVNKRSPFSTFRSAPSPEIRPITYNATSPSPPKGSLYSGSGADFPIASMIGFIPCVSACTRSFRKKFFLFSALIKS